MAVPIYSERFIAATVAGAGVDYTAPNGYRVVLRDLTMAKSTDALPIGLVLALVTPVPCTLVQLTILGTDDPPYAEWHGRIVLYAGDSIHIATDALADVSLSGYLLQAP